MGLEGEGGKEGDEFVIRDQCLGILPEIITDNLSSEIAVATCITIRHQGEHMRMRRKAWRVVTPVHTTRECHVACAAGRCCPYICGNSGPT
jgi:hypothetical protein